MAGMQAWRGMMLIRLDSEIFVIMIPWFWNILDSIASIASIARCSGSQRIKMLKKVICVAYHRGHF